MCWQLQYNKGREEICDSNEVKGLLSRSDARMFRVCTLNWSHINVLTTEYEESILIFQNQPQRKIQSEHFYNADIYRFQTRNFQAL
jgi:hypothetical protein